MSKNERIKVGAHVTIYPRGKSGIWCADFWRDGRHCRQSLGTKNKKVAEERARKLDVQLADGVYQAPAPSTRVAHAVNDYLDCHRADDRARRTVVKYAGVLATFGEFLRNIGVEFLHQITASHFDRFRVIRRQQRHPKTLYTEGVIIKGFLKWAKIRKLIRENPIADVKLRKPHQQPKAGPSLAELERILDAAAGTLKLQLAILILTGMRSGELQRLQVRDLDSAGHWINVVSRRGAETKTRTSRKVPIHPQLRALLANLPRGRGDWLFTAEPSNKFPAGGNWINPKKLNDRFVSLCERLNLPTGRHVGYTIHSLRHSFETITVNAGIPQRVIDAWLGHSSDKSMAAVYYRLSDEDSQLFMKRVPFGAGESAADAE